ncbi:MAG: hypothetical protein E7478_01000 [Ruminococcaceae bacterium]|nr:hypothetical protein [Oscillospiraceae bacterium]
MDIIEECYRTASEELQKITCYDIPTDFSSAYTHHSYSDGHFYEHTEGDRGEKHTSEIGSTKEEFISHLLYCKIRRFSHDHELHHRRKFESNLRQANEITMRCYSFLDGRYKCPPLSEPSDNVHICFDLLEHYIKVCSKLMNKHSIPEETMRRIKLIAEKQYASAMGGMHDIAFTLDYVRYNVAEITKAIALPALEEEFIQYEEQYERLMILEKEAPHQKDRYPLGFWNNEVFREAEEMLSGKRLKDGAPLRCALYMLMNAVHIDRAVGLYIELCFHKDIDIRKYRTVLDEMFIADKYGVYFFGPAKNFSQERKDRLSFKILCKENAER